MFWMAAAWASVSEPPFDVDRRSMLPQRSNRYMPTNSKSSRSVTGDVSSTCVWRSRGKRRSTPASAARVAVIANGQLQNASTFCSRATLAFGVACQVIRRLFCWSLPRFSAGLLVSGVYVHTFGLNAFLSTKMPANELARLKRVENQNQTLSFLIGPPSDSFRSQVLS